MIIDGLKFGMLLQFAIGPMCLMVFNTSAKYGLNMGLLLMLSISLVDAFYIILSALGVGSIMKNNYIKKSIKIFGMIILTLFGANMIFESFNISLLPSVNLFANITGKNIFIQGLLLTSSNPLTIIFWSGVLSTQVIEKNYTKTQMFYFGLGCVLSTIIFLTTIAFLGTTIRVFLSDNIMKVLNTIVGSIIIYFGIKLLFKKEKNMAT